MLHTQRQHQRHDTVGRFDPSLSTEEALIYWGLSMHQLACWRPLAFFISAAAFMCAAIQLEMKSVLTFQLSGPAGGGL